MKIKKNHLIIGGVLLVSVAAYFYFKNKKEVEVTTVAEPKEGTPITNKTNTVTSSNG
jgi:hypothetical protein